MASLLIPAAASFLPSVLSGLFGGRSSAQKLREQMLKVLAPQNFAKLAGQFYQQGLASPAFAQGQRAIGQGANLASSQLQAALGARGIGQSGTGAVLSSLTPSLVGSQMAGLYSGAWNQAQGQAQSNIQQQLAALQGTAGPSETQQLFAAGLSNFSPFLQQWLGARYPGIFGGQQPLPNAALRGSIAGYQSPGYANPQIRPRVGP